MKTFIAIIVLALIGFGAWFYLKQEEAPEPIVPTGEEVTLTDGSYVVSTSSSSFAWRGSRPLIPGYFDNGTVNIQSGNVEVDNGVITGGSFTIDMTTITALSTGRGDGQDMLTNHLKSIDFFDVEDFPTSTFVITGATATGEITGSLTVKDATHPITISSNLSEDGNTIRAQATVELDRTRWNVRYGSGQFFQDLGNNLISDTFTVTLDLVAERAQ